MMKLKYLIIALMSLYSVEVFSQKEANVWYFDLSGLNLNTGEPEVLGGFFHGKNSSNMCDSAGNFLFATNGDKIWNKNGFIMQNGDNLMGSYEATQGCLIVPKPGSSNLYYVFTTAFCNGSPANYGLYYSVVDMNLDGGLGAVTNEKNVFLSDAWDAAEKIVGCRHANGKDIWIITRKFAEDGYAAFLLTKNGVNSDAVFSVATDMPFWHSYGSMKISYNKKYLVTAFSTELGGDENPDFEICSFNDNYGELTLLYTLRHPYSEPHSVEFSPDSKYLYLSFYNESQSPPIMELYQYDMNFIQDSTQFIDSEIHIVDGPVCGLQLSTDGKIYCTTPDYTTYEYISVIHDPWKRGTACNYEENAVYLEGGNVYQFLPNILIDYRFEWEGRCSAEPFAFQSNFQPTPSVIL